MQCHCPLRISSSMPEVVKNQRIDMATFQGRGSGVIQGPPQPPLRPEVALHLPGPSQGRVSGVQAQGGLGGPWAT